MRNRRRTQTSSEGALRASRTGLGAASVNLSLVLRSAVDEKQTQDSDIFRRSFKSVSDRFRGCFGESESCVALGCG